MPQTNSITAYFGSNLAELLSDKILTINPSFDTTSYILDIENKVTDLTYTQRVICHAEVLKKYLPQDYLAALDIITGILGPENPSETGMFKHYYWILPLGKYVELFGLDHFTPSVNAIAEITKRNTGEYAIRPYIRRYPQASIERITEWAQSENFHLRRLASEGLRPKLPWTTKLDTFIDDPYPVFDILSLLKEDPIKFVQKSVANHITDYLKVLPQPTEALIAEWKTSSHPVTQWICKHATRKYSPEFALRIT
ncbi:DNA alkylation repair protein [Membranihabitans marinus]|uniref:DNA alkylation repair protein n=1 Tax=Membranihabitans marinus TaxID=1227546 RepID=UPI001F300FBD|nr:DNA alkylation repair protein [Membranihabitans marinus]